MRYRRWPLFVKILAGAVLGGLLGAMFGPLAAGLKPISDLVLQALTLLATPLIFLSLLQALLTADIRGRMAGRLMWVLLSNTSVAAVIGLGAAALLAPGTHVGPPPGDVDLGASAFNPLADLLGKIPKDFVNPFANNDVIGVLLLGLLLGFALRGLRVGEHRERIQRLTEFVKLALDVVIRILHWVFELIPLAVLAVVARVAGTTGVASLADMGRFVACVVIGLAILAAFYAVRLRFTSHVRPLEFMRGASDALVLAFSTASSAATLPVTFECATQKLGIREESAALGIMVGGTFNHDGGALYQAASAVFVSQVIGRPLAVDQLGIVVLMAVVASVCTAGIPSGGLVTMVAVFKAVHLPIEYIPLLLPVDWLLDRCRTTINVTGDLVATCIVDRSEESK